MKRFFKFSWHKLFYGLLLTVLLFFASGFFRTVCGGCETPPPQTGMTIVLILAAIPLLYVIFISIRKLIGK